MQMVKSTDIQFTDWIQLFNSNQDISEHYYEHSVFFYEGHNPITGSQHIAQAYEHILKKHGKIINHKTVSKLDLIQTQDVIFELGELTFEDDTVVVYLLGWRKIHDQWMREIESVSQKTTDEIDHFGLNQARSRWGFLASSEGAESLVNELYTETCHYFNRGVCYCGRESLVQVYQYMNDDQYSVELSAIISHPVTKDCVFELGKWSIRGFYDIYMVIWEKGELDQWRMRLDSNW